MFFVLSEAQFVPKTKNFQLLDGHDATKRRKLAIFSFSFVRDARQDIFFYTLTKIDVEAKTSLNFLIEI